MKYRENKVSLLLLGKEKIYGPISPTTQHLLPSPCASQQPHSCLNAPADFFFLRATKLICAMKQSRLVVCPRTLLLLKASWNGRVHPDPNPGPLGVAAFPPHVPEAADSL